MFIFLLIEALCLSDTTKIKSIEMLLTLFESLLFCIILSEMRYSTSWVKWLSKMVALGLKLRVTLSFGHFCEGVQTVEDVFFVLDVDALV